MKVVFNIINTATKHSTMVCTSDSFQLSIKTVLLISVLALFCTASYGKRGVIYTTPVINTECGDESQIYNQSASSEIGCGVTCFQHENCSTFYFDEKTNTCVMSSEIMDNTLGTVFGSHNGTSYNKNASQSQDDQCPTELGYKLYRDDDDDNKNAEYCLKFIKSPKMTQPEALKTCSSLEGGHLILPENTGILNFINNQWEDVLFSSIWVDGMDCKHEGNPVSWKGKELTYPPWKSGPHDNTGCDMLLKTPGDDDDFSKLSTCSCSDLKPFICQNEKLSSVQKTGDDDD